MEVLREIYTAANVCIEMSEHLNHGATCSAFMVKLLQNMKLKNRREYKAANFASSQIHQI